MDITKIAEKYVSEKHNGSLPDEQSEGVAEQSFIDGYKYAQTSEKKTLRDEFALAIAPTVISYLSQMSDEKGIIYPDKLYGMQVYDIANALMEARKINI